MTRNIGLILVTTLAILFLGRANSHGAVPDDAYMFIRYANNFWAGHGIAWNPDGVASYGTTSILYEIIIIIILGLFRHADYALILSTTSALFGLLTLMVITLTCWQFIKQLPFTMWVILIFVMILPTPLFRYHSVTGMDATLSMFCNSLLLYATLNTVLKQRPWWPIVIAAFFTFQARPDNLIYIYLFPVLALLWLKQAKREAIGYTLAISGLLVIDALMKTWLLNSPLPLPFFAKSYQYYDGYLGIYAWNPMSYLIQFSASILPFLILLVLFTNKQTVKLIIIILLPAIITFSYLFTAVQIMGMEARFYVPFLPYFIFAGFYALTKPTTPSLNLNMLTRILVLMLLTTALIPPASTTLAETWQSYFVRQPTNYNDSPRNPNDLDWGKKILIFLKLSEKLPPNTKVSLSEYGYIGALAPQIYIVDTLGLHAKEVAYHGFSADNLMTTAPDIIWLPHYDYSKLRYEITHHPQFKANYDFYPLFLDGIAIKKNNNPNIEVMTAWLHQYENFK